MAANKTVRVLVVDDNPADQLLVSRALKRYSELDFDIEVVPSARGLSDIFERIDVDVVLIDYNMPGQTGLEFLRSLPQGKDLPPIIMLTGSGDELVAKEAILAGAYDYFLKSRIDPHALGSMIRDCLAKAAREREARRQKFQNERLAVIDPLTDLYNRRYLADALRRECGRAGRYGSPLSCLMIDLDGFKRYNDVYGHLHGDAILRQVAELISASIRDCDIAARYGGDEFCVILTETDHEGARRLAERLRSSIAEQCLVVGGRAVPVTASIGVFTSIGRPGTDPDSLVGGADNALRRAKTAGKNSVHASLRESIATA